MNIIFINFYIKYIFNLIKKKKFFKLYIFLKKIYFLLENKFLKFIFYNPYILKINILNIIFKKNFFFLKIILKNNYLKIILNKLSYILNSNQNFICIKIFSNSKLLKLKKKKILKFFKKKNKSNIKYFIKINKKLIGGYIIKTNSEIFDNSIKNTIKKLYNFLK